MNMIKKKIAGLSILKVHYNTRLVFIGVSPQQPLVEVKTQNSVNYFLTFGFSGSDIYLPIFVV